MPPGPPWTAPGPAGGHGDPYGAGWSAAPVLDDAERPERGRDAYPPVRWGIGDVFYGLLVLLAASFLVAIPFIITNIDTPDALTDGNVALVIAGAAATWVGLGGWPLLATYLKGQRSVAKDFRYRFRWIDVPIGFGGGLAALALGAVIAVAQQAAGVEQATNTQVLSEAQGDLVASILVGLVVSVGAPVFEELFFRGLAYGAFEKRLGTGWAIGASTVLFGVLHFQPGPGISIVFLIVHITGFGLILGLLRWATNRCGASVFAHLTINLTATLAILVAGT